MTRNLSAIILLFSLLFSACAPILEPEIREVSSFKLKQDGGMAFEVGINVFNPNKMRIAVTKYDLDIFVNGMNLGKASSEEKQFLRKKEEKEVLVHIKTDLMKLLTGGLGMLAKGGGGDLKIRIRGEVYGKAYGVVKRFYLDEEMPIEL